jgi:hypothetical protein
MSTVDIHGNRPGGPMGPGGMPGGAPAPREVQKSAGAIASGSMLEAIGGAGAVVLSILGLAQVLPVYLAAVAVIAVGGALVCEGAAIAARYNRLMEETTHGALGVTEVGGGMSVEFLGGGAGVVLGILSLLGVAPQFLLPISAIVLGGTLVLGSASMPTLNSIHVACGSTTHPMARELVREAVLGTTGTQAIVGLGAVVLGIIGLVGFDARMLTLVAMLSMGGAILLSGSALTARMVTVFSRARAAAR